jgi:hypothetical protein
MAAYPWEIIRPRAATNFITNPSFETATTGWAGDGSTITRVSAIAKYGAWALDVTPTAGTTDGAHYAMTLAAASAYAFSIWVKRTDIAAPLVAYVYNNTTTTVIASTALANTTAWQRVTVSFTTTGSNIYWLGVAKQSSTSVFNWYLDGAQLETTAASTYIDGDQAGCRWNGTRHASTSVRDGRSRAGGDVLNLATDFSFLIEADAGSGMPPVDTVSSEYGLLPGDVYQRSRAQARALILTGVLLASSLSDFHTKRRALLGLFDPPGTAGGQPTIIRYTGGSQDLELDVYYDDGLQGQYDRSLANNQRVTLQLIAPHPYWRQIGNSAKSLSVNENITNANYIVQRTTYGLWQAVGTGMNSDVYCVTYGPDGYLYAGGNFTTAGGTGVNYIAYWNGSAWLSMNGGFNGAVNDMAFTADGRLIAVGNFTTSNGATATVTNYIAQWNGTAWSAVGSGTAVGADINAVAIGTNGDIYIGGAFASVSGNANAKGIAKWDGSAWSALSTGTSGADFQVRDIAIGGAGNVFLVGGFDLAGGVAGTVQVAKWTPANSTHAPLGINRFDPLGTGITPNPGPYAVTVGQDGVVYVGGDFVATAVHPAYIARWMGSEWRMVGNGVDGVVRSLTTTAAALYATGEFTSAGGIPINDRIARWAGSVWHNIQIDLPGSPFTHDIAFAPGDDLRVAIGFSTAGTAVASNVSDTVVTNGGTAPAGPEIRVTGPGTLESIINMTTGRELRFDLYLQAGEVATLDLRTGRPSFTSTFRSNLLPSILASHPSKWKLEPGDNTVLVKMSATTGASSIGMMWREEYLTNDV